jgi:uncharacterized repeat protein (TIGR02543 family)
MKKPFFGIAAFIVISLVFISCPNDPGVDGTVIPINPSQKTLVIFDNTYGICTALVYDDYRRRDMDRVAEIPAGQCSDELEWTPSTSTPFYFAYRISLKDISGFFVDFVPEVGKDQKAVRLSAGTRTVIPIPVLDEAVSSEYQVLSPKSYLSISNNSNYSFQLHRGVSMIRPDNFPDSGVVNSGERAPYTINPGRSSDFRLLVGADYKPFPNSPDRFEAGNFYSYKFTDTVSLNAAIPINLDNIDIKTYTVHFDGNGGSGTVPASQSARIASVITLPLGSGLTNGDEIFGGWCADSSGAGIVYSAGTTYTVTGDITLYAKWYPAGATLYTVAFDSAGGNEIASQSMVSGAVAIRPADPYRTGYTFGGWYQEPGAQSPYDFTTPITGSFTLYAAWSANKYTVTFHANGADGAAPASVTVDYGYVITLPGAGGLSKPDETFHGWNTEDDRTGTGYASGAQYTVTADVTLFAMWSSIPVYEMLLVPGGSYEMGKSLGTGGSSDISPVHTVTLSAFYMGKYEVTQTQYEAVMGITLEEQQALAGTNTTNYGRGDNYPMYYVSWYDALVFCNKLSMAEGLSPAYKINNSTDPEDWGNVPTSGNSTWDAVEIVNNSNSYRLPTEAEWEYAAKGGNGSPGSYTYAGSNNLDEAVWYTGNAGGTTHVTGTKAPNGLGIYDMSGNVWEWCWDWYGNYSSESQTNPTGAASGADRVIRGGSWYHPAQYSYSVFRSNNNQYRRNNSQGFRLVRSVINTMTPVISAHPSGGTYSLNAHASPLTVQASVSDGGTLSYRWYRNTANSNSGGTLISGAGSASYTPPTNAAGTVYYYVVVTNTNNSVNGNKTAQAVSDVAAVVVTGGAKAALPVISLHPLGGTYLHNDQARALTIQANASDGGTLSYQWYKNTVNNNSGGTAIPGAVNASYTPPTNTAGTVYYYVVVSNSGATAVSDTAAIMVIGESSQTFIVSNAGEFASALSTIQSSSNDAFIITIAANMILGPQNLTLAAYHGKTIILRGNTTTRTITLSGNGSLFTIGAQIVMPIVVLIDIKLNGHSSNNTSLVKIDNGMMILNEGAEISGNTVSFSTNVTYTDGGGVTVNSGASLKMYGGTVRSNTLSTSAICALSGAGIVVKGTFEMRGGSVEENVLDRGILCGAGIMVENGGVFKMYEGNVQNNRLTGNIWNNYTGGMGVYVNGLFEMYGGSINNNTIGTIDTTQSQGIRGGGVFVNSSGVFTMRGGEIAYNGFGSRSGDGGGVYTNGSFILEGGDIHDNKASPDTSYSGGYGGGVYHNNGTLALNGGHIFNNTANIGGGVYIYTNATMNGTIISANYAMFGGGIANNPMSSNSRLTIESGVIKDNVLYNNTAYGGAGICGVTIVMNGGEIINNSIESSSGNARGGGGIYCGSFTMSGGRIENNSVTGPGACGGGVYSSGTVVINGGSVSENVITASNTGYGAGVYASGNVTMNGAEAKIANNKAGNGSYRIYGGGMYSEGAFTFNDGLIIGNDITLATNQQDGGGVYIGASGSITMSGGRVAGNRSWNGGGIAYNASGIFRMTGGIINGNTAGNRGGGLLLSASMGGFQKMFYGASTICGIIFGSEAEGIDEFGYNLKNTGTGAAIYYNSSRTKNATVDENTPLSHDSSDNWAD